MSADSPRLSEYTLLHSAVLESNAQVVKFLLKHGANPNARMRSTARQPLQKLLTCDAIANPEMRELFFRYRSSSFGYSGRGGYASCSSSRGRSQSNATELCKLPPPRRLQELQRSPSPVHLAAASGNRRILELLLDYGGDVSAMAEGLHGEYTPLVIAILSQHRELVELLISKGAEVSAGMGKDGKTPLYHAVKSKQLDMVQLLLSSGADVNAVTEHGVTPLHVAVERKLFEVAELLLKNGSEVNARTKTGVTPLHSAAVRGSREMTELLLSYGGDVRLIMKKGEIDVTPLLWVTENESRKIRDIVYKHAMQIKGAGVYGKFFKKIWKQIAGK